MNRRLVALGLSAILLSGTPASVDSQVCADSSQGLENLCEYCTSTVIITSSSYAECGGCLYNYTVAISCPGIPYSSLVSTGGTLECGTRIEKRFSVDESNCDPPAVAALEIGCGSCPEE